jgi:hypothetical protein
MWSWKNGLKTGMYYLRTKPAEGAMKVTVDPSLQKQYTPSNNINNINNINNTDNTACESCSA